MAPQIHIIHNVLAQLLNTDCTLSDHINYYSNDYSVSPRTARRYIQQVVKYFGLQFVNSFVSDSYLLTNYHRIRAQSILANVKAILSYQLP